jgi:hypothetical protein
MELARISELRGSSWSIERSTMAASGATLLPLGRHPERAAQADLHRRLIPRRADDHRPRYLDKGCGRPACISHENEQRTYILEGRSASGSATTMPEVVVVHEGEVLHIPAHCAHRAEALEDTLDVVVSLRLGPTGSTARTRTCGVNGASAGPGG